VYRQPNDDSKLAIGSNSIHNSLFMLLDPVCNMRHVRDIGLQCIKHVAYTKFLVEWHDKILDDYFSLQVHVSVIGLTHYEHVRFCLL